MEKVVEVEVEKVIEVPVNIQVEVPVFKEVIKYEEVPIELIQDCEEFDRLVETETEVEDQELQRHINNRKNEIKNLEIENKQYLEAI